MHPKGIGLNVDSSTINGDLEVLEKTLAAIQESGFNYAEIPVHGVDAIFKGKLNWLQTRIIIDILKEFKLKYTVHGPDLLNLMDSRYFKLQREVFKSGIEFAQAIGAEIFVYHSGKISLPEEAKSVELRQNNLLKIASTPKIGQLRKKEIKTLQELAFFAQDFGVTIAMENGCPEPNEDSPEISRYNYGINIENLVKQVREIDRENVGITIDFGHAYLASKYYHFKFLDSIKLALPYIKHLHIHDCFGKCKTSSENQDINLIQFGIGDMHMPIGWGEIPYEKIFRLLKNYDGVLCLELKPRYKKFYKYSLERVQELIESTSNNHKFKKVFPFTKDDK